MNHSLQSSLVGDHIAEQRRLAPQPPRHARTRPVAGMRRRLGLGFIQLGLHVMSPPRPPVLINSPQWGSHST
ncbi:MAG TPA: hypothetical protein VGG38_06530 [Acidimicrobiales bacterium]|jgi:hypothetical protein